MPMWRGEGSRISLFLYNYYYYPINYLQALLTRTKPSFFPLPLFVQLFSSFRLPSCPFFHSSSSAQQMFAALYRNSFFFLYIFASHSLLSSSYYKFVSLSLSRSRFHSHSRSLSPCSRACFCRHSRYSLVHDSGSLGNLETRWRGMKWVEKRGMVLLRV